MAGKNTGCFLVFETKKFYISISGYNIIKKRRFWVAFSIICCYEIVIISLPDCISYQAPVRKQAGGKTRLTNIHFLSTN